MLLLCIACVLALGNTKAGASELQDARALPSPEQAIGAFARAEALLTSAGAEDPGSACSPFGSYIALRLDGSVVASGTDSTGGPDSVKLAAQQPIEWLTRQVERYQTEEQRREMLGVLLRSRVTIELQLAGVWRPTSAQELAEPALAPGLMGIAVEPVVRVNREKPIAMFPSRVLDAQLSDADAARVLVARYQNRAEPNATLETQLRGANASRFPVVELAQLAPGRPPTFLSRGQKTVPGAGVTTPRLRAMLEETAGCLVRRVSSGFASEQAGVSSASQAAAAYALARAAAMSDDPTVRLTRQAAARQVGESLVAGLHRSPGASAFVLAMNRALGEAGVASTVEVAARALRGPVKGVEASTPAEKGVQAFGLAELAAITGEEADRKAAREALSSLYSATGPGGLLSAQPWATWAELRVAELEGRPTPAAGALRELRGLCWTSQLSTEQAGPNQPDLAGGFRLTGSPWPTWQSLRPLGALAAMAGDPAVTRPEERAGEVVRLLDGLRFIDQLRIDESVAWRFAGAEAADRIRASTWSVQTPLDAQSLAVLALVETLESFERIAGEGGPLEAP